MTLVAAGGIFAGYIALSDKLRDESIPMISKLSGIGVTPVLLTGDNDNSARAIAASASISEVHANCLPETKLSVIDDYQSQGISVCMIGDGINDAPALKKANVGIAITGVLNPVVGTLVHNCGSVLVIINSALLLHWKKKQ